MEIGIELSNQGTEGSCKSLHRDNQFLHCRFVWTARGNSSRSICCSGKIFLYWIMFSNLCSFVTVLNFIWANTIEGLDEEADTLLALVLMVLDFLGAITTIYRREWKHTRKPIFRALETHKHNVHMHDKKTAWEWCIIVI